MSFRVTEIEIFLHWMHNVRHADYTAITIIDQKNCSAVIQQSLQWTETDGSSQQPVSCLSQADFTCISYNHSSKYYVQMCKELQLLGDFVPQIPYCGFAPGPYQGSSVPRTSWLANVYSRPLWGIPLPKNKKSPKNSMRPKNQRHEFMAG